MLAGLEQLKFVLTSRYRSLFVIALTKVSLLMASKPPFPFPPQFQLPVKLYPVMMLLQGDKDDLPQIPDQEATAC